MVRLQQVFDHDHSPTRRDYAHETDLIKPGRARVKALLALGLALIASAIPVRAQTLPETHFKVIGNLAGVTQYTQYEEPFWTKRIKEASGGAITAEIAPYDRSGINFRAMLQLIRLGVVPLGTSTLAGMAADEQEVFLPDLAGLSADIQTHRRMIAAYRPHLKKLLADRHGIELLAVYVYPAQVMFCRRPFASLSDLKDRRIRTSNVSQSDLVEDLGGVPVVIEFKAVAASLKDGAVDCAITGGMSGNLVGLPDLTTHMHTMAIAWGPSAFMANKAYWDGLAPEVRVFLTRELAFLERDIWDAAERETLMGAACNSGRGPCLTGRPGRMTIVEMNEKDAARVSASLRNTILPRWIRRCGDSCKDAWNTTIGPLVGLEARN